MNRDQLDQYLGRRVRVTNPSIDSASWEGVLLGLADFPTLILRLDNGSEFSLPQSFTVEDAPPEPNGDRAVIRDRAGDVWVRTGTLEDLPWQSGRQSHIAWRDLLKTYGPVVVLSEGLEAAS